MTALLPGTAAATQLPGVHAHVLWSNVDDAEMDRQLDAAKNGGAKIVRTDLGWSTLEENGKGQYSAWYLSKVDRLVNAAQARGLKLLISVVYSPCWASSAPETLKQGCGSGWWGRGVGAYPPNHNSDYGDAMAFLAARYRGRVAAWELWNEPNLDGFWNSPDPARDYANLVKATYPRIKSADPGATVVAGAMADAAWSFTRDLYRAGIKGSFDALSIHPYSGDNSPLDPLSDAYVHGSFVRGVPAVRQVMADNGDDRPMWLTEFGYNTSLIRNSEPWLNGVGEDVQARWLEAAYKQMREWSYVAVGVWYNVKDRGTDRYEKDENYGLVRYDNTPKPAYAAYQRAAAATSGSTPTSGKKARARAARSTVRFRIVRQHGRLYIRGSAPKRARVRFAGYRFDRHRSRFRTRAATRFRVRASRKGRFSHRLSRRLVRRGTWRFSARVRTAPRTTMRVAIR